MPRLPAHAPAGGRSSRRRILASYSQDSEQASAWLRDRLHAFARTAADALERAGADVVFVDAGRSVDDPATLVAVADGVLALGGGDLDPAAFGQPALAGKLYGVDPRADAFELALTNAAGDPGHAPVARLRRRSIGHPFRPPSGGRDARSWTAGVGRRGRRYH